MRVRLNDPSLVPDLLGFLERSGLMASAEADGTVSVYVPPPSTTPAATPPTASGS